MEQVKWLQWATELQAIAQNGFAYCNNDFDKERYQSIQNIAAEIIEEYSSHNMKEIPALFFDETGYRTPKLDVRGVIFKKDQILLVKERSTGNWTLPGGWVDINESPSESVVREVFEESGFTTKVIKMLALYDKQKHDHPPEFHHIYKCFFLCDLIGGEAKTSIETSGVDFFREDNLPQLCTHRVTANQITRFFEHRHHLDWPTEFD